jgi:hypothetical protein
MRRECNNALKNGGAAGLACWQAKKMVYNVKYPQAAEKVWNVSELSC